MLIYQFLFLITLCHFRYTVVAGCCLTFVCCSSVHLCVWDQVHSEMWLSPYAWCWRTCFTHISATHIRPAYLISVIFFWWHVYIQCLLPINSVPPSWATAPLVYLPTLFFCTHLSVHLYFLPSYMCCYNYVLSQTAHTSMPIHINEVWS